MQVIKSNLKGPEAVADWGRFGNDRLIKFLSSKKFPHAKWQAALRDCHYTKSSGNIIDPVRIKSEQYSQGRIELLVRAGKYNFEVDLTPSEHKPPQTEWNRLVKTLQDGETKAVRRRQAAVTHEPEEVASSVAEAVQHAIEEKLAESPHAASPPPTPPPTPVDRIAKLHGNLGKLLGIVNEVQEYTKLRAETAARLEAKRAELEPLTADVVRLQKEVDDYNTDLTGVAMALDEAERKVQKIKAKHDELTAARDKAASQRRAVDVHRDELAPVVADLMKELADIDAEIAAQQQTVGGADELATLIKALDRLG